MQPAGRRAFERRDPAKSGVYTYENAPKNFPGADEAAFRANAKAWAFFNAQPPGYRRLATGWVLGAKREETRARRLATLIDDSAHGRRLAAYTVKPKATPGARSAPARSGRRSR